METLAVWYILIGAVLALWVNNIRNDHDIFATVVIIALWPMAAIMAIVGIVRRK